MAEQGGTIVGVLDIGVIHEAQKSGGLSPSMTLCVIGKNAEGEVLLPWMLTVP